MRSVSTFVLALAALLLLAAAAQQPPRAAGGVADTGTGPEKVSPKATTAAPAATAGSNAEGAASSDAADVDSDDDDDDDDDDDRVAPPPPPPAVSAELSLGRRLYRRHCADCHGLQGDGQGPVAASLEPLPRDFRRGEFKLRSTPSGSLPLDTDLVGTVKRGIRGTAMFPFGPVLNDAEILAVVRHVKTFSKRFAEEEPEPPILIQRPTSFDGDVLARGKKVYEALKCAKCHGETGVGDGPAAATLEDDQKRPIKAYDFTKGNYKAGSDPEGVYRTFMTGMTGTPMPSYADSVSAEDAWALTFYNISLHRSRDLLDYLLERPAIAAED